MGAMLSGTLCRISECEAANHSMGGFMVFVYRDYKDNLHIAASDLRYLWKP